MSALLFSLSVTVDETSEKFIGQNYKLLRDITRSVVAAGQCCRGGSRMQLAFSCLNIPVKLVLKYSDALVRLSLVIQEVLLVYLLFNTGCLNIFHLSLKIFGFN